MKTDLDWTGYEPASQLDSEKSEAIRTSGQKLKIYSAFAEPLKSKNKIKSILGKRLNPQPPAYNSRYLSASWTTEITSEAWSTQIIRRTDHLILTSTSNLCSYYMGVYACKNMPMTVST